MSTILLNPGPVTLSRRVREAMLRPDLCHREPEFSDLQSGIRRKLLAVYGLDPGEWAAVLLTGSGTSAVEAMLGSLVPADGELVVVENGAYGERMSQIAVAHRIACTPVRHGWEDAVDPSRLRAALARVSLPTHRIALVHHETTSGRLNDLAVAGPGGRTSLLVDAVSSFGAEQIDFTGLAACASTANKCLHGVPGVSFVLLRRSLLEGSDPRRGLYLDLAAHCRAQDAGDTLFTPAVQACYALDEALTELDGAGGWTVRRARYRALMEHVRGRLIELAVEPLLPEGDCSCVLSAFRLPHGLSYERLHDGLKRNGFVIYAGQGRLAAGIFRIAVMGEITDPDMERLLGALSAVLG